MRGNRPGVFLPVLCVVAVASVAAARFGSDLPVGRRTRGFGPPTITVCTAASIEVSDLFYATSLVANPITGCFDYNFSNDIDFECTEGQKSDCSVCFTNKVTVFDAAGDQFPFSSTPGGTTDANGDDVLWPCGSAGNMVTWAETSSGLVGGQQYRLTILIYNCSEGEQGAITYRPIINIDP